MIKTIVFICFLFAPWIQVSATQVGDVVQVSRSINETKRKAIVAKNMHFTASESRAFWPVYNAYRTEVAKISDRLVALVHDYAKNHRKMTNPKAATLLKEFLSIKVAEFKLKKKYVPKFSHVLSARKVARFYHMENKMDNYQNVNMTKQIPLIW